MHILSDSQFQYTYNHNEYDTYFVMCWFYSYAKNNLRLLK